MEPLQRHPFDLLPVPVLPPSLHPPCPTRFEKMAESCKKNVEILKLSQARGLDPPKHHFEERTHRTVRLGTPRPEARSKAGSDGFCPGRVPQLR